MEEPSKNGIEGRVVDVVNLIRLEFGVPSLPANKIPHNKAADGQQGEKGAPVDSWVAEEEVLDDVVVPAAHSEADMEDGPLPKLGGEVILFVRIRDKGIVGGHHRDVEVEEVAEEGRLVGAGVAGGNWELLAVY